MISAVLQNQNGAGSGPIEVKSLEISPNTTKPRVKKNISKKNIGITSLPKKVSSLSFSSSSFVPFFRSIKGDAYFAFSLSCSILKKSKGSITPIRSRSP